MYFASFADFIAMGGHALYVWLAYSIAIAVLSFNILSPLLQKKRFMAEQARRLRREQRLAVEQEELAHD